MKTMTSDELFYQIRNALLYEKPDLFDDQSYGPQLVDILRRLSKGLEGFAIGPKS